MEFRKPVVTGTCVASGAVLLLGLLLALLADLMPGGAAVGGPGRGAGRGERERTGALAGSEEGTGDAEPRPGDDPATSPTAESVEITDGDTEQTASSAAESASRSEPREPVRKADVAPFTISALSRQCDGEGEESRGSGRGFSDVEDRLKQAGARSGDVQISLAWNNHNDIDLHVITPDAERIMFNQKTSRCGGELDVDMNAGGSVSSRRVENVYWPAGRAPKGEFVVIVHHYANHGGKDPTRYQVIVKVDSDTRKFSGSVSAGDSPEIVHRFTR